MISIVSGIEKSAVYRLKKTWKVTPKKMVQAYSEVKELCDSKGNYKALRAAGKTLTPPIIPYLGVYLSDCTFIEDGNPVC